MVVQKSGACDVHASCRYSLGERRYHIFHWAVVQKLHGPDPTICRRPRFFLLNLYEGCVLLRAYSAVFIRFVVASVMVDASQLFHCLGRLWSYKSPARVMFMRRLAFQPWRCPLARRRPHTGQQQCGGGHHDADTTYSAAAASTVTLGVLHFLRSP